MDHKLIGLRIAERRKSLRMSQQDLATKMLTSRSTISQQELGNNQVTVVDLQKFVKVLKAPLAYFMGEIDLDEVVDADLRAESGTDEGWTARAVTNLYRQQLMEVFDELPINFQIVAVGIVKSLATLVRTKPLTTEPSTPE